MQIIVHQGCPHGSYEHQIKEALPMRLALLKKCFRKLMTDDISAFNSCNMLKSAPNIMVLFRSLAYCLSCEGSMCSFCTIHRTCRWLYDSKKVF